MGRSTNDKGDSVTRRSVGYTSPRKISEHPDMIRLKELVKKLGPDRKEQLMTKLGAEAECEEGDFDGNKTH